MKTSPKDLENTHLRHAMLAALHNHLKNYMQCMDRNYFGPRSDKEIELTKKLHEVMEYTESVLNTYYVTEADIME